LNKNFDSLNAFARIYSFQSYGAYLPPHQQGVVEHVIVASGEIEVLINSTWHLVRQHEGLRFCADKSHGYRNMSSLPAVFHDMIHYKRVLEDADS
jgi:hypothetical protein